MGEARGDAGLPAAGKRRQRPPARRRAHSRRRLELAAAAVRRAERPFDASFSGSIKQEAGSAPGLVAVKIASAFTGPVSGQLAITIEGQPLSDGGVQMSSSQVTLGLGSAPQQYRGQIVQLSGNHLVALVSRGDGHRLSLGVSLTTDPGSGSVRGRMSAPRPKDRAANSLARGQGR